MKNEINRFAHCIKCVEELPKDQTAREYARLEVGFTTSGALQIWCVRHEINVAFISDLREFQNKVSMDCAGCGTAGHGH